MDKQQGQSEPKATEEMKRTPEGWQDTGASGQQPSTTSEPAYGGSQGQQQPAQEGERPDDAGQVDDRSRDLQSGVGGVPSAGTDEGRPRPDDGGARPER
jgi:hypothetical protein